MPHEARPSSSVPGGFFWLSNRLFALPEYALNTFTPRNLNQSLVHGYLLSH
jgi:hypothetical protein